ncbi:MAG: AmmeMemoRadiSam system protein B [Chitinivibrionales bacterium]|nr:AmmeMemoRadiSam system protein B [Chitinivibrionales bacterium]
MTNNPSIVFHQSHCCLWDCFHLFFCGHAISCLRRVMCLVAGVTLMTLFNTHADETKRNTPQGKLRPPAVAGQFYPGNPKELKKEIEAYLSGGPAITQHPTMIISPHAGYIFSGAVAGIGFATVSSEIRKVILLGPSHRKYFSGLSIADVDAYETPLGTVPLLKEEIQKLRSSSMVHAYADADELEHCLEVQLPFLQVKLPKFSIIPILTGAIENSAAAADLLYPLIDDATLVVISSDFSHYNSSQKAKQLDKQSVETILNQSTTGFLDACGESGLRIAMHLAKKLSLKPQLLDMHNSFETAPAYGKENQVVGYVSIAFVPVSASSDETKAHAQKEPAPANSFNHRTDKKGAGSAAADYALSPDEKAAFLTLARQALEAAVRKQKPPQVPATIPPLGKQLCGCFVTLTIGDNLRGCIGYIEGIKPLAEAIIDNAKNAALSDPRFDPVDVSELAAITVEVSILTKPESFTYSSTDDLLRSIRPNIDGIILKKGFRQSTFLPQVWEQLPDKVQFLEHLALKAGLDRNDWKHAEYKKYQAIHFK